MCIDWSEKPEPLFKAIQHSINTPFALWQSSTAAPWLIRLLLPCQSIMNHPLCHRTTLHSPAGRKKGGGRTAGSGIKMCGGRIGREMEGGSRCWRRKSWRKRGEGRLAGMMKKKGKWQKSRGSNGGKEESMKEIRILMPRESYEGGRHGLETLQDGHERITWNKGKTEWKEDGAEEPVKGAVG